MSFEWQEINCPFLRSPLLGAVRSSRVGAPAKICRWVSFLLWPLLFFFFTLLSLERFCRNTTETTTWSCPSCCTGWGSPCPPGWDRSCRRSGSTQGRGTHLRTISFTVNPPASPTHLWSSVEDLMNNSLSIKRKKKQQKTTQKNKKPQTRQLFICTRWQLLASTPFVSFQEIIRSYVALLFIQTGIRA